MDPPHFVSLMKGHSRLNIRLHSCEIYDIVLYSLSKEPAYNSTHNPSTESAISRTQHSSSRSGCPFPLLIFVTPRKRQHIRHIQNQRNDYPVSTPSPKEV